MNLLNLISVISIISSLTVALFVLRKNIKGIPNIAFALGMLCIGLIEFGDYMSLVETQRDLFYKRITLIGESLLPISWLIFSLTYSRKNYKEISLFWKLAILISIAPLISVVSLPAGYFFNLPYLEIEGMIIIDKIGYYFYLFILIYSVLIMANLEETLRSSSGSIRWRIKFFIIGCGGIMASLIYYYSHVLLYRIINMNLIPVREAFIISSILLITISLLRQTFQKEEISISRNIFYKSFTLLTVGLYLLGLSVFGAGIRYIDEDFGRYTSVILLFIGSIVLISFILSERIRRRVKVFIDKNFYKDKYDYRAQWLNFTQKISSTKTFEELLSAVLETFASAMGATSKSIWLYNKSLDKFIRAVPRDIVNRQISLKGCSSLISFFKEKGWVFNVKDEDYKEIIDENREFFETTRAMLVIPLMNNGDIIGFVELGGFLSNEIYSYEDYDFLKTLAKQTTFAIMKERLEEELLESREMEAVGRISSFVIHDIKNMISAISMSAENAIYNLHDPEFQKDMIKMLKNTSEKMKGMIKKLSDMTRSKEIIFEIRDLVSLVQETANPFCNGKTNLKIECSEEQILCRIDSEEIKKVFENLLINSIESSKDGVANITINIGKNNGMACVIVRDDGCGMSPEYIEKYLFKPFYTTKKKGIGIGLYQCKNIIEIHGGSIHVQSTQGVGTEVRVCLPLNH